MIATIKRPGFEMRGDIPPAFLEVARKYFGKNLVEVVEEAEDRLIDITDTDWYKERKAKREPGHTLRLYRTMHKFTQSVLAKMVGALPHHISEMESGKRAISKAMALRFAEIFEVSPDRFI
jgi:DNA-binding XRE family transcriptional regulator